MTDSRPFAGPRHRTHSVPVPRGNLDHQSAPLQVLHRSPGRACQSPGHTPGMRPGAIWGELGGGGMSLSGSTWSGDGTMGAGAQYAGWGGNAGTAAFLRPLGGVAAPNRSGMDLTPRNRTGGP